MEIKCGCSEGDFKKIVADKGGIHFDICLDCFYELGEMMNVLLLELLNMGERSPNISRVGVRCDQCNQRKVGTFHRINTLHFHALTRLNKDGTVDTIQVNKEPGFTSTYFVCDDCFLESSERKFFIKSGRNVYISESLDKTVENLFSDLEKTDALFTLVPTEVMKRVLKPSLEDKTSIQQGSGGKRDER